MLALLLASLQDFALEGKAGNNVDMLGPISKRARKFLVVADGSNEARAALRFAAGRAAHVTGGELILFHCIEPARFQHWMSVEDVMREEAREEASERLTRIAARVKNYCGLEPRIEIHDGEPKEEILNFIKGEPDMFLLILGAGEGEDPGPLVDYFSGPLAASLSCPLVIVPGHLGKEDIDAMV